MNEIRTDLHKRLPDLSKSSIGRSTVSEFCELAIKDLLEHDHERHPFSSGVTKENAEGLLGNYLAMSQAFPFLQAGASAKLFLESVKLYGDVPKQLECGFVVGSFLVWDEVGGHYCTQKGGAAALPSILRTGEQFHSNLLRKDIEVLLGKSIPPLYSDVTKNYLRDLSLGLGARDHVERCAAMVAFEHHARTMIENLWSSLVQLYGARKEDLTYFHVHVGGEDPAEAYHVNMTKRMIDIMVPRDSVSQFLKEFEGSYSRHEKWCEEIKGADACQI